MHACSCATPLCLAFSLVFFVLSRSFVSSVQWSFVSGGDDSSSSSSAVGTPSSSSSKASSKSAGKHVVFHLVVREFFELSNYLQWHVVRRFAEFDRLHRSLKAQFSGVHMPALPEKTPLLSLGKLQSKPFLDARMHKLELYLQQLVNNTAFQVDEVSHTPASDNTCGEEQAARGEVGSLTLCSLSSLSCLSVLHLLRNEQQPTHHHDGKSGSRRGVNSFALFIKRCSQKRSVLFLCFLEKTGARPTAFISKLTP